MRKWLLFIVVAMMAAFVLAACGDAEETTDDVEATNDGGDGDTYVVGATQIVEHPSLDEAYKGFQDSLEDAGLDREYNYKKNKNDKNNVITSCDKFEADDFDLIYANSAPSALGALNATDDIPILFTSVTDAVDAELVSSMDEPGDNITGVV